MAQSKTRKPRRKPAAAKAAAGAGEGVISRIRGRVSAWRSRLWAWRWRLAGLLAALALLPVALTLVYAIPGIHPVSTLMVKDAVLLRGYDRQWVGIDDIAPVLVHSVIMSEDGQFCRHHGIDFGELNAVIGDALEGEPVRGASTIPMQTVKNLYLWGSRSFIRKLLEAPYAILLDAILSKKRIMEIYLNIAELGPGGIYGVEAAAQHHFGKSAARLSAREAALLAVTLPNPFERNPAKPGRGLKRIASIIEKRARGAGDYVGCVK